MNIGVAAFLHCLIDHFLPTCDRYNAALSITPIISSDQASTQADSGSAPRLDGSPHVEGNTLLIALNLLCGLDLTPRDRLPHFFGQPNSCRVFEDGPERRRRWDDEERLRILAEAFAPGACVADVARLHGISTARIYTWRAKLRQQIAAPEFAEAVVDVPGPIAPATPAPVIVVELGGRGRVNIFAAASPDLAAATLQALR